MMANKCPSQVLKPLLLSESTLDEIPKHASDLVASILEQLVDFSEDDILVVLLFVMMMETGFKPADSEIVSGPEFNIQLLREVKSLPKDWINEDGSGYTLKFKLGNLDEFVAVLQIIKLVETEQLQVDLYLEDKETPGTTPATSPQSPPAHLAIVSTAFVTNVGNRLSKFCNLDDLSNAFKDVLCVPMRTLIMSLKGLRTANLEGLPDELKLEIFQYCETKDLLALSETCKLLKNVAFDQHLWKCLSKVDFAREYIKLNPLEPDFDWRAFYIKEFQRKQNNLECTRLYNAMKRRNRGNGVNTIMMCRMFHCTRGDHI